MKRITELDYLGTQPTLFINGKTSYKTFLGGTISIIFFISLIMGVSYFFSLLISKETFTISSSEEYNPNVFASWNNLEFSIVLVNNYGLPYPEQDRLYSVVAMWLKWEDYIKPDNTTGSQIKMVPIKLEKCNITKHFEDPSLWRTSNYLDSSYCTETNQNFNLSKTIGARNYTMINFWVHRCKNTTTKKDCYSEEKIEQDLLNANIAVRFKNFYFDHKKTKDIGMPYIFRDAFIASSSLYRRFKFTIQEVEYFNDHGLVFPGTVRNNYVTFNNYRESTAIKVDSLVPDSFLEISFENHVLKQIVKKNYYKFQNMIADIGGLLKAALTILTFFNNYFSDKLYFHDIIEENISSMCPKKIPSTNIAHISKSKKVNNRNVVHSQINLLNYADNPLNKNKMKNSSFEINDQANVSKFYVNSELKTIKSENKKSQFCQLKLIEIIIPFWCIKKKICKNKNLAAHYSYKNFIIKLLDVRNIVKKINNLDKICTIITGNENKHILENCINPYFFEGRKLQIISEFNEVKTEILNTISDFILNSYVIERNTRI
jgi:hypothetical protein